MSEKKSIYSLSIKEMRKLLRDFSNTLYGRTVFFLAYFVPMMAFLVMAGLVVAEMIEPTYDLFFPIVGTFFLFVGLFWEISTITTKFVSSQRKGNFYNIFTTA